MYFLCIDNNKIENAMEKDADLIKGGISKSVQEELTVSYWCWGTWLPIWKKIKLEPYLPLNVRQNKTKLLKWNKVLIL